MSQIVLKFCIAYGAFFAQLLVKKKLNGSCQVTEVVVVAAVALHMPVLLISDNVLKAPSPQNPSTGPLSGGYEYKVGLIHCHLCQRVPSTVTRQRATV